MKKYTLAVLFCCLNAYLLAQSGPLTIGSKFFANNELRNLVNVSNNQPVTGDYRDKIIILDFWNTHCSTCIKSFPGLSDLQEKYKNRLQIIGVTQNSLAEVKALFQRVKIKTPSFPIVVNDRRLNRLFPHEGEPLHVWIDEHSTVRFITHGYNATEQHVQDLLSGKPMQLSFRDQLGSFDDTKPLLSEACSRLGAYVNQYSILLNGLEDRVKSYRIEIKTDSISGDPYYCKAINASILTLFNVAYDRELYGFDVWATNLLNNNRIELEMSNSRAFQRPTHGDSLDAWRRANVYSYELAMDRSQNQDFYKKLQSDFNLSFPYQARVERRTKKYLAIVRTDTVVHKSGNETFAPPASAQNHFQLVNKPFADFLRAFLYTNQFIRLPIVDETKFRGKVTMNLQASLTDLPSLRKELNRYHFDLVEKEGDITMLVIRDHQ